MNYHSLINLCNDHIRKHPSEDITAQVLADLCGYSLYHLSSVFRACLGCSVGRFIMEERLRLAAYRIRAGRKITDVALDCGFDTASGFTKAFRRQFGCSPREYRDGIDKISDKMKNMDRHLPQAEDLEGLTHGLIRPEFVKRSSLKVYGYVIPVEDDDINHELRQDEKAAFWSRINFKTLPSYPEGASDYAEVSTWINPDRLTGKMDYFFGYVTSDRRPADGFHEVTLAAGDYAIFRLSYPASGIKDILPTHVRDLWRYIFGEWLTENDSVVFDDSRLCFEKYGAEKVEVCVPVKAKKHSPNSISIGKVL